MKTRVNAIKFRTSTKNFSSKHNSFDIQPEKEFNLVRKSIQPENDNDATNFWPGKP